MPYVHDHAAESDVSLLQRFNAAGTLLRSVSSEDWSRERHQWGWRSTGELAAARADLLSDIDKFTTWGQSKQIILAMERVDRALRDPLVRSQRDLPVYDRDYTEEEYSGRVGSLIKAPTWSSNPGQRVSLSVPSIGKRDELNIRSIAEPMIRNSAPTKPHANLGQWFGELRDSNRMFGSGILREPALDNPRYASDAAIAQLAAGGYLNYAFGWNGFVSELKKSAEAIVQSEELVREFLVNSAKLHRRTRTKVLSQGAQQYTGILSANNYSWRSTTVSTPAGTISVATNPYSGFSGTPRAHWRAVVSWREEVRSFSLFEYFVADPQGALGRLNTYSQQARLLLGNSVLSASTIWELTPWTWMGDWFVDVGGLLAFQESVATDSLVCRRSGSVYEWEVDVHGVFEYRGNSSPTSELYGTANTFYHLKGQRRRKGSPYGLAPNWDGLTSSQWAIVGALGLTSAPRAAYT